MSWPTRVQDDHLSDDQRESYIYTLSQQGNVFWKPSVATDNDLPATWNDVDDHRIVESDWFVRKRDWSNWVLPQTWGLTKTKKIEFSSTEIWALVSTPSEIIPNPWADKFIEIVDACAAMKDNNVVYNNRGIILRYEWWWLAIIWSFFDILNKSWPFFWRKMDFSNSSLQLANPVEVYISGSVWSGDWSLVLYVDYIIRSL